MELAPQFTDITEELDHDTFIGGADYEINSKDGTQQTQIYTSASYTNRDSYYGGLGGAKEHDKIAFWPIMPLEPPKIWHGSTGVQITKTFQNNDVLTAGAEFNYSTTEDQNPGYDRLVDQNVNTLGGYAQYEWKPSDAFSALLGARVDNVNVLGDYSVGGIERDLDLSQTGLIPQDYPIL